MSRSVKRRSLLAAAVALLCVGVAAGPSLAHGDDDHDHDHDHSPAVSTMPTFTG
jgi:hypothetical protein